MKLSRLGVFAFIALGLNGAIINTAVAQTPQNPYGESVQFINPNAQRTQPRQSPEAQIAEAAELLEQGFQQYQTSRYREAIQSWQQALEICRNPDLHQAYPEVSRNGEAWALNNLGLAYNDLSQYEQAIDYLEQALPIFQAVKDRSGEAAALNNLGRAYRDLRQYQQAIDYFEQALPIFQAVENRSGKAKVLSNLGIAYGNLSQYDQAIAYYQQALPILRDVGDRASEGFLLASIGRLYAAQNSPVSAIQQLQKSVEVRQTIRADLRGLPQADQQAFTDSIADDYRLLAELLRQQGRSQEAQAVLDLLWLRNAS